MGLPDLSRLAAAPPATLRTFGHKLVAAGVSVSAATPVVAAIRSLHPALRSPARTFFARKRRDPAGFAMRMFLFEDPVTSDEASAALGEMAEELIELGLLERSDAGVVSPFVMGLVDDLFALSDAMHRGPDVVMGLGETSVTLGRAIYSRRKLRRALDLGCGSGTGALVLSRAAAEVVGTDINPRAIALSRINAAINGVTNIDFRVGDRFSPVGGETFDLISSQPPFVAKPEAVGDVSALYGGSRGDELPLSVLAEVPRHLARGGRAVLFVQWPVTDDSPVADGVRRAVGAGPNLLVLQAPTSDVVNDAIGYAAGLHRELGPAYDADVTARLAHFEATGIRGLSPTLVVVERAANDKTSGDGGWTSTVPVEAFESVSITSERVDDMLAARTLARRGEAALLDATLRVPDGTLLSQVQVGPGAEVPSTLSARFAPDAGMRPIDMTMELLFLITIVHEAKTVREAIPRCAEVMQIPLEEARSKALAAIAEALEYGVLQVAPATPPATAGAAPLR